MKSLNPFPFIGQIIKATGNYFTSMNSETGKVSIKRNVVSALTALLCFVVVFSMVHIVGPKVIDAKYIPYVEFVLVFIGALMLLILGVTSIEKMTDLIQKLKAGIFGGNAPTAEPPSVTTTTTTEVKP